MQRITLPIVLCCLFGVETIRAVGVLKPENQEPAYEVWEVDKFPNPQIDYKACNRTVSSFVCDPNDLLKEVDALKLDSIITKIKNSPACACPDCSQGSGLSVGVAVFNHFFQGVSADPKIEAKKFAQTLLTNWKLGSCGDAILVLLAVEKNQFVVLPGKLVSKVLALTELEKIRLAHTQYFKKKTTIYTGLELFLTSISAKLGNVQKSPLTDDQASESSETNESGTGLTIGLTVGFIALAALFAAGIVLLRRKRGESVEPKETLEEAGSLAMTVVDMAKGTYKPVSEKDPAENKDNKQTKDEELAENSEEEPIDESDLMLREGHDSDEERENDNDDGENENDDGKNENEDGSSSREHRPEVKKS